MPSSYWQLLAPKLLLISGRAAAFDTKEMGVTKEIITQGDGVTKPSTGQELTMHYTGTLMDGKEFDSSVRKNRPFRFRIGIGAVIQGNEQLFPSSLLR